MEPVSRKITGIQINKAGRSKATVIAAVLACFHIFLKSKFFILYKTTSLFQSMPRGMLPSSLLTEITHHTLTKIPHFQNHDTADGSRLRAVPQLLQQHNHSKQEHTDAHGGGRHFIKIKIDKPVIEKVLQ